LQLLVATGRWPSSPDCRTTLFIQAPPCLVGRAQKSMMNRPIGVPSDSRTS